MEIINKIKEGLYQDNNIYDQPDMTMRDNLNGVITDIGNGNFKWSNIKGNSLSFTIGTTDKYFAHCKIKDRLFIITLNQAGTTVKLLEIVFSGNTGTKTVIWSVSNSELNLSFDHPIRTIWGFYENVDIQRIYWSDWYNPPRCINVEDLPLNNKFVDFFPVIDKVYGRLTKSTLSGSGSVLAGNVFFAWRFYTDDGYYTDWSYLSNPVSVTEFTPGTSVDDYQKYQGMAPDENSGSKITIELSDLDSDYDNIQVAAFYSNDYNLALPGSIFYDGTITSDVMLFIYSGTENLGTITIDDLILTSVKIDSLKESIVAKKQNVIACMNEREELDLPGYIEATITVETKKLPIDITSYPGQMTSATGVKALCGLNSAAKDRQTNTLIRGQWYKAITEVVYNDGTGPITITENNMFYVSTSATSITYTSGTFKAIVIKKKYLIAGGTPGGDINTNYRFEYEFLEDEHYDWKSQKVCKTYKSYPQGEVVRLGVLFFDLTGRPFFVRHIRNTNVTYGPGDTTIPKRSDTNPMLTLMGPHGSAGTLYYDNVCANLQYLKVSGIDITDIKDQIGGFMIVRMPIVRQYLGMGILTPTHLETNSVYSATGMFPLDGNAKNYFGCYDFHCPEDFFDFKGFVIHPKDELENIVYVSPYYKTEAYTIGAGGSNNFYGMGRRESNDYDFYQKLFIENNGNTSDSNGVIGASHEIISRTRYELGDDELEINPLDATKKYNNFCHGYYDGYNHHAGINNTHSVVILDIDDIAGNIKGPNTNSTQTNPLALICALKRPNADPYGGYSDSSIANSVYMAVGHFQEVTETVLADILSGGRYVFNEIDVFGGDTFVQLFDLKRLYINYDETVEHLGHSIIFPVESRINLALREGEHVAKTRSYDSSYNMNGIRYKTGNLVLEEYNYNDGYSSDDINDKYLPLPFNFKTLSEYLTRIRYSPEKNYGEKRDSFRIFRTNDYIDLDPNKGEITNIRSRNDRIIYWQPDEVGYIPIKERALTQTSVGQNVQLGVGGIFERYDALKNKIGNSHQFGLIESPIGYHWFDSRRKLFLSINDGLQLTPDSIVKGLDSWFQNNIPDNFEQYDNPLSTYGVFGGYDEVSKMIFVSFTMPSAIKKTIGIHASLNKFIGLYQIDPGACLEYKNHLFHINPDLLTGYIHGTGTYMNFFGTQYHAYVSIVIKEDSNIQKVFDNFEIIGNTNFFTKVTYANSTQTKEEVISDYSSGSCVVINRNYKYRNKRWLGNFPVVSRERLNDGYLLVTFEIESPYLIELFEMKTLVRKNI